VGGDVTDSNARTRTVTWTDPLAALPSAAGMSGLEFMNAVVSGKLPPPPIMGTMGITGAEVEAGKAVFRGEGASISITRSASCTAGLR